MRALLLPLAFLVLLASPARAESQKIGILGLEVNGATDFESITVARNLTAGLRTQVGKFPKYTVATNSNKELIDEKVSNSCESEGAACMAKIGKKLGAQVLVYGHIEKKPQGGQLGYQLSLKLLDTDTQLATPYAVWIPLADTAGELNAWASKAFANVVGAPEPAGPTVGPIIKDPVPPKPGKPGGGWRMSAYVAGGVTVLLLGGMTFYGLKVLDLEGKCKVVMGTDTPIEGSDPDCFKGDKYAKNFNYTAFGAAAIGGFAIFATYKGWFGNKRSTETNAGRSTRKKKTFAVTPIVSPDGAGATVRFDW
ncbi:MAG: hypothetical protein ABI867_22925 [Kofleriaceae bacterium]